MNVVWPLLRAGAGLFFWFWGALIVLLATNLGGRAGGWLWAPLFLTATGAAVTWSTIGRRAELRPVRIGLTAAVVVVTLPAGIWIAMESPASHGRIAAAFDRIDLPPWLALVTTSRSGNSLCFDDCPSVSRVYRSPRPERETLRGVIAALRAQGFTFQPEASEFLPTIARRGDDTISIAMQPDRSQTEVILTYTIA